PLNARHKTVYIPNLNMHVQLCEDSAPALATQSTTEESSLPPAEEKAIPAGDVAALGVINLSFSEDPRILWGLRIAEKPDDLAFGSWASGSYPNSGRRISQSSSRLMRIDVVHHKGSPPVGLLLSPVPLLDDGVQSLATCSRSMGPWHDDKLGSKR
ncbi:hypothetical protein FOZ63_018000, partial [Perkinsus olseni]